ncbi:MAG: flagellar biosynthesis protein FlhA [Alphaproteobacteria bacterium]|nr:flagellar biosynthesis protein FlhA [Alphaproteobacteria bacterium]
MAKQPVNNAAIFGGKSFKELLVSSTKRGDIFFALAIILMLVILIMPMPAWLLDIALAFSITLSCLVLMTAIFIEKPTEFSAFPLVLLITTMYRLSLNLASTRLILANGYLGPDAAGQVIKAFGGFIMGNNFVIGVIVFAILVLVNFVVITKGSGRIAEVAARFALDAMPGKQMAIDADLSSGLITEEEARARREDLAKESSFYGAMDGASKFVRGDAIAGLIITFINIVAGIIIGMVQNDMSFAAAGETYTRLTVGDGLVSQVPALIISVAAGILVSKAGMTDSTDKVLFEQVSNYPKALGMSAFMALALGMLPGTPAIPFVLLSVLTGVTAYYLDKQQKLAQARAQEVMEQEQKQGKSAKAAEEPIANALRIDLIRLEIGYGLLPLINDESNRKLTDQIKALRRALASDLGFVMPSIRIQDNMQLEANEYNIYIKEVKSGRGELRPTQLLVMDPRGEPISLPGEKTTEPTFGLKAMWVDPSYREEAMFRGYTVVDPATVVTTHITELVKDNMPELLSYAETQKLLDEMDKEHQKLIKELIPSKVSLGAVQRILQNLLQERVSIRDLPSILEGISEAVSSTRSLMMITEHVRARLARQLSNAYANELGIIPLVTLSPEWEHAFAESIVGEGDDRQLAMAPTALQTFITKVRDTMEGLAIKGESAVLLTSPGIRPFVRSIIERFRPMTVVMSQNEIHPKAKIKTVGQI